MAEQRQYRLISSCWLSTTSLYLQGRDVAKERSLSTGFMKRGMVSPMAARKANQMFGTGMKLGLGGVALTAAAAASTSEWHSLLKDFGFPVALVVFFVWASWTREERSEKNAIEREHRITTRVSELERFNQNELMTLNAQCIQAVADNTAALTRLVVALESRPCLCEGVGLLEKINMVSENVNQLIRATENGNA